MPDRHLVFRSFNAYRQYHAHRALTELVEHHGITTIRVISLMCCVSRRRAERKVKELSQRGVVILPGKGLVISVRWIRASSDRADRLARRLGLSTLIPSSTKER